MTTTRTTAQLDEERRVADLPDLPDAC